MGSLFSSPAPAGGDLDYSTRPISLVPTERFGRSMSKQTLASLGPDHDGRLFTPQEVYAGCICRLANRALKHYNSNNPGAEFEYHAESTTTEMKAAFVGFREHFLWYHLGFSARRRDNQETHLFFAELCYHIEYPKITVQTCIILEKPLCRFRSSCAFCPEESKILHPSEQEFVCGKEGQRTIFFRRRHMLVWPFETDVGNLNM
uniref:Uncharacterized protein n=1 Tax=Avena sativa TaxID=4498 RepID=A0ACD5YBZ8_AVESA